MATPFPLSLGDLPRLLSIAALSLGFSSFGSIAPANGESIEELKIDSAFALDADSGKAVARLELGKLETGKEYRIRWNATNKSGKKISFDNAELTCSCTDLSPRFATLLPGETFNATFSIRTNMNPGTNESGGGFWLKHREKPSAHVIYKYQVKNYLGFGDDMVIVVFRGEQTTQNFECTIVGDQKHRPTDLRFSQEGLSSKVELQFDPSTSILKGTVKLAQGIDQGETEAGSLKLFAEGDVPGKKSVPILVQREPKISVTPKTFRFFPTEITEETADSEDYKASVLVSAFGDDLKGKTITAAIRINNHLHPATVKRLANGIWRVNTQLKKPFFLKHPDYTPGRSFVLPAHLEIQLGDSSNTVPVALRFPPQES
jgi:hypothetical protein